MDAVVLENSIKGLQSMTHTYCLHIQQGMQTLEQGNINGLQKNTRVPKSRVILVKRAQKQSYATDKGEPSVLIDDYIKNIKEWEQKGGIGIHHTSVSKTLKELSNLGLNNYKY